MKQTNPNFLMLPDAKGELISDPIPFV